MFDLIRGDRAVYNACEPHSEVDADSVVYDMVDCFLEVGIVKVGQEAKGAKGEGQDGWDDSLEQP